MSARQATPRRFPWMPAILGFAALSHAAYLIAFRHDPFWSHLLHDAQRYHDWGSALAAGQRFEPGAFSQAPLYPWLVGSLYGLVGASPGAVYFVQWLLGVAAVALIGRVARRAYGDSAASFAAAIATLSGTLVFYESKLVPGTLSVLLALLIVDRLQDADLSQGRWGWVVAGLSLGAAVLTSSAFVLAVPAAMLWAIVGTRPFATRARNAALIGAAAALVVLPVTVRNRVVSGDWVLVATNGGITFWQGNNPAAQGSFATPEGFSGSIHTQREEARAIASAEEGRPLTDAQASSHWLRRGLDHLREDPSHAVSLIGSKLALAFAWREQPLEYDPNLDDNPWRRVFIVSFGVIAGLAAVRVVFVRERPRAEGPVALVGAVVLAVLLLFYVSSRYRLPLLALLCAPAGAGASLVVARIRQGFAKTHALSSSKAPALSSSKAPALRQPKAPASNAAALRQPKAPASNAPAPGTSNASAPSLPNARVLSLPNAPVLSLPNALAPAVLALAVAAASWAIAPLAFGDLRRVQTAMALGDRGAAWRAAGDLDRSIATYRRALQLDPSYVYLHLDLGKSLSAAGRPDAAEPEIREALRLAPDLAEGWRDLGVLLYQADRLREAEAAFAKAFALDPGDEAAANNLAGTRARLGDIAGAREVIRDMRARGLRPDPALERMTGQP